MISHMPPGLIMILAAFLLPKLLQNLLLNVLNQR